MAASMTGESLSASDLVANLEAVSARVKAAAGAGQMPRLVAVSKLKPVEDIQALYDAGHRDFGENYVQEMVSKAGELPTDIRWRFIGTLQSNKAKAVAAVPNVVCVETVGSAKLANKLNKACEDAGRTMQVMVQVNTSDEDQKGGVAPEQAAALAQHTLDACPALQLTGLMTIGAAGQDPAPFFQALVDTKRAVLESCGAKAPPDLELSMGMSGDFEAAIKAGSSSVRVGSSIFGARPKKSA